MAYRDRLVEKARKRAEEYFCWREAEPIYTTSRTFVNKGKLYTIYEGTGRRTHSAIVAPYSQPLEVLAVIRQPRGLSEAGEKWKAVKNFLNPTLRRDADQQVDFDSNKGNRPQKDERVLSVIAGWATNPHRNIRDVIAATLPNYNRLYLMFVGDTEFYGITQEQFQRALDQYIGLDKELASKLYARRHGGKKPGESQRPRFKDGETEPVLFVKQAIPYLTKLLHLLAADQSPEPERRAALKDATEMFQELQAFGDKYPNMLAQHRQELESAARILNSYKNRVSSERQPQGATPKADGEGSSEKIPQGTRDSEGKSDSEESRPDPEGKRKKNKADVSAEAMLKLMRKKGGMPKSQGTAEAISEWEESQDDVRRALVSLLKGGDRASKGMYLWGRPGTGKTEDIKKMMKTLSEEYDFTFHLGTAESFPSKKACVEFLYKHRDKDIVVIDEAEKSLNRSDVVDVWKAILNLSADRKVTYNRGKDGIPPFQIQSKFVFLANTQNVDEAVRSRLMVLKYDFPFNEMIAKVRRTLNAKAFGLKPNDLTEVIDFVVDLCRQNPEKFNYRSVMLGIQNRQLYPREWKKATKRDLERKQERRVRSR
jgi:hypothetical protein